MSNFDFGSNMAYNFSKDRDEEEKLQIQRDLLSTLKEIEKHLRTIARETTRFNDKVDIVDFLGKKTEE